MSRSSWYVVCILTGTMLPPYIIEQLRQREEARRHDRVDQRVRLELPLPERPPRPEAEPSEGEERGVFIIQVG